MGPLLPGAEADRDCPVEEAERQHGSHHAAPRPAGLGGVCSRTLGPGDGIMESLCQQTQRLLSDLLSRDLDSAELEQLDGHLSECGFCREQARSYWRLHRALGELAAQNYREQLEADIRAALQGAEPEPVPAGAGPALRAKALLPHPLRRYGRWLAAAVLLLALGIGWHLGKPRPTAPDALARLEQVRGEVYRIEASRRIPA